MNGKVYIIGGYDGQLRLSLVECLDLNVDDPQWQAVAPMSQRRGLAGVCVYRGKKCADYNIFVGLFCQSNFINLGLFLLDFCPMQGFSNIKHIIQK